MNRVRLFLIFLLMPAFICAQSNKWCSDDEAKTALSAGVKAKNHQEAYQQYDFAERVACAPELKRQAKEEKQQLFNKIERLRIVADSAKNEARRKADWATRLKDTAEVLAKRADEARISTEKALDSLRAARDATEKALQDKRRSDAILESNEWLRFGEAHIKNKDYDKAKKDYQKGLAVLDSLLITDSLLQTKIEDLHKEIGKAHRLQIQFNDYECHIKVGDSLARSPATVPDAFQEYFAALKLGLDTPEVKDRLARLEATFVGGRYSSANPKGVRYYDTYTRSAETNLLLDRPAIAEKRVRQVLRNCRPIRYDFMKNTRLKEFANEYSLKPIHRMEFEVGVSHYLASGLNFFYSSACLGTQIAFGDNSAIGIGLEFQFAKDRQLSTASKFAQLGGRLYYAHTLFALKNNLWNQIWLRVQGLGGISSGYSKLTFPFRPLADVHIEDVSGLTGGEVLGFPVQFERQDVTYQYVYNSNDKVVRFNYQIPGASFYTNIMTGISIRTTPFVRHQEFGLFLNLTYQYQIQPLSDEETFAVGSSILDHFETSYHLSPDDVLALNTNLSNAGLDDNFIIRTYTQDFSSGFNVQTGVTFRF